MIIEIRTDELGADLQPGDVFEVMSVDGDTVKLQRVYRPKPQVKTQPPTLGISVGDGVGVGDRVG